MQRTRTPTVRNQAIARRKKPAVVAAVSSRSVSTYATRDRSSIAPRRPPTLLPVCDLAERFDPAAPSLPALQLYDLLGALVAPVTSAPIAVLPKSAGHAPHRAGGRVPELAGTIFYSDYC